MKRGGFPLTNKRSGLLAVAMAALATSCGGGSPVKGLDEKAGFLFPGIQASGFTFDPATGKYTLTWAHPGPNVGYYFIYRRYDGQEYDFKKPWRTSQNFVEQTEDLRFEPRSCFLVRFAATAAGTQDENTKEVCTSHEQIKFEGLSSVQRDENSDYVIRWGTVPIPNVVYSVFTGSVEDRETVSFVKSAWETTESFLRIDRFELGRRMCFAVRFNGTNPIVDQNTKVLCTDDNLLTDFSGIEGVDSPDTSTAKITWLQSGAPFITGYTVHVYQGTMNRKEVKTSTVNQLDIDCAQLGAEDPSRSFCTDGNRIRNEAVIQGLIAGGVYFFSVRAHDGGNHEDTNEKTLCLNIVGDVGTEECPTP